MNDEDEVNLDATQADMPRAIHSTMTVTSAPGTRDFTPTQVNTA
jgi:hypothetical protein